jgi:hypothetical protein
LENLQAKSGKGEEESEDFYTPEDTENQTILSPVKSQSTEKVNPSI